MKKNIDDIKKILDKDVNKVPYKDYDIGKNLIQCIPNYGISLLQLIKNVNKKYVFLYIILIFIVFIKTGLDLNNIDNNYIEQGKKSISEMKPVPNVEHIIIRDDNGVTTEFAFDGVNCILRINRKSGIKHTIEVILIRKNKK